MKIDLLVPDLSHGGQARAAVLAQALLGAEHLPMIYGTASRDDVYLTVAPGIGVTRLKQASDYWKRQTRPDAVIAVKARWESFGTGLVNKLLHGVPLVLDIDDWELAWPGRSSRYSLHALNAIVRAGGLADAVTATTRFLQRKYRAAYLPNGCDTRVFRMAADPEKAKASLGLSAYRVLMFAGAARPHKGIEDVLHAVERLGRDDLRLVLVGKNPYDDFDTRLAARWPKRVIRLPALENARVPEYLAAADVIVVPQRENVGARAQFPIKLVEAMAMGKPILTTTVGDIPEIVADAAVLARPGTEGIACRLAEMLTWSPSQLAELGSKARARSALFSTEAIGRTLDELLRNIVGKKRLKSSISIARWPA